VATNKVQKNSPDSIYTLTNSEIQHIFYKILDGQPIKEWFLMVDAKLLDARKKLEASPHLTDAAYKAKMSYPNDEENINNLKFGKKTYDILDHVVINPVL